MFLFHCFVFVYLFQSTVLCFECPAETDQVPTCSDDDFVNHEAAIGSTIVYSINNEDLQSNRTLCPRAANDLRWKVTMNDNSESPITTGIFCSQDIIYNSSEICVDSMGTLHIQSSVLIKDKTNGFLNFNFISSVRNVTVPIRYGVTGVYPFNSESFITVNEGFSFIELYFIIFTKEPRTIQFLFNGMNLSVTGALNCVSLNQQSQFAGTSRMPVSVDDHGNYTARDANDTTFRATIFLNVIPNPPTSPPSSMVTLSSTTIDGSIQPSATSATASVTSTSTSSASSSGITDNIVWLIIGVSIFFGVVILIVMIIIIGICCYANRRNSRSSTSSPVDNGHAQMPDGSPTRPTKNDFTKSRLGSTSSERPLTKGGSNPSVNSSHHDTTTNYTAVYCSGEFSQCGLLLKEKHGGLIHILDNLDDVRLALIQPHCTDILLFTDPSDLVFKEIMSCGVDPLRPDSRNKLRVIKFVTIDGVPSNTIGVNGYRFVFVEGPPDSSTLLTAISKAEYPELVKESTQSSSNRHELLHETNHLLRTLVDFEHEKRKDNLESHQVQQELMELHRETNEKLDQTLVKEDSTV